MTIIRSINIGCWLIRFSMPLPEKLTMLHHQNGERLES
ncbi:hypothetical protein CHCC20339_3437 [Bacillus licheniformis]|nr:hypothetical protein CHCC20339_3437 [Bacillus licheniformis]